MKMFQTSVLFLFTIFVFTALIGLHQGMATNQSGDMEGCIFTGKMMLCKMNAIEHISLWQSIFTAVPQELTALLSIPVLMLFALAAAFDSRQPQKQLGHSQLHLEQNFTISYINPLNEAFSRGILHPKIYEFPSL